MPRHSVGRRAPTSPKRPRMPSAPPLASCFAGFLVPRLAAAARVALGAPAPARAAERRRRNGGGSSYQRSAVLPSQMRRRHYRHLASKQSTKRRHGGGTAAAPSATRVRRLATVLTHTPAHFTQLTLPGLVH